jgi:hypothetical protein
MANRHPLPRVPGAGWAYQWIAQLGFERNSWTAPLDVQRVHPADDASAVAIRQIKAFVHTLPADELSTPVFVFDAGYDPVALALGLETTPTAILVRLRSNRCFYADPGGYIGNGRPRRHGAKFVCTDAATWPEPTSEYTCDDPGYGQVRVRAWAGLHSVVKVHQTVGSRKAPSHRSGHRRPRRGCPLAGTDTQATDALALLARPGQAGSEHCLAGIHPSFRSRPHHQVQQADPQLDDAPTALARAGR